MEVSEVVSILPQTEYVMHDGNIHSEMYTLRSATCQCIVGELSFHLMCQAFHLM